MGWYDYYSLGLVDISPTYGSLKEQVDLEAALYDLKSEKRLWSVLTRTVIKDETDRLAAVDRLVEKIVGAMVKDRIVP